MTFTLSMRNYDLTQKHKKMAQVGVSFRFPPTSVWFAGTFFDLILCLFFGFFFFLLFVNDIFYSNTSKWLYCWATIPILVIIGTRWFLCLLVSVIKIPTNLKYDYYLLFIIPSGCSNYTFCIIVESCLLRSIAFVSFCIFLYFLSLYVSPYFSRHSTFVYSFTLLTFSLNKNNNTHTRNNNIIKTTITLFFFLLGFFRFLIFTHI